MDLLALIVLIVLAAAIVWLNVQIVAVRREIAPVLRIANSSLVRNLTGG